MYSAARWSRIRAGVLQVIGEVRVVDALTKTVQSQIVPHRFYHSIELADVGPLVADGTHQEAPVARHPDTLAGAPPAGRWAPAAQHRSARAVRRHRQRAAFELGLIAVRRDYRRELGPVVHRRVVVEDHLRQPFPMHSPALSESTKPSWG